MKLPMVTGPDELEALVEEIGFLPFFESGIPGFSLKDCTPPEYWFVDGVEGPWEWREVLTARGNIAYGKLFRRKAGFVSREWYPRLCNYRRDGYDFDARYDDGLASHSCKMLVDQLVRNGPMLSSDLRAHAGVQHGFDGALTLLQMQTYLTVHSFSYKKDRFGHSYGWGIARYALSEQVFGEVLTTSCYREEPVESKRRILAHLSHLVPEVGESALERLIR